MSDLSGCHSWLQVCSCCLNSALAGELHSLPLCAITHCSADFVEPSILVSAHGVAVALALAVDASAVAVPVASVVAVAVDAGAVAAVAVTLVLFLGLGIFLFASKAR